MGENVLMIDKNKVRRIMKLRNIKTQSELADKMGITKNQLSNMLSPKFCPVKSNVQRLLEVLECDLQEIVLSQKSQVEEKVVQLSIFDDIEDEQSQAGQNTNDDDFVDVSKVTPKRDYTVVELFAGAGGLALGLEKAGFKTVGLVEIDKHCANTLRANRPHWNVINEDIQLVAENGIRKYIGDVEVDLLSGGYPCQAFSYAGKKLGFEDTRGTLFYPYAKVLEELKPKMFLAENVRGLVSHDRGRTLKTMIDVFEEIGYNVTFKVLNAWDYGVAQKRERIIIVGVREDIQFEDGFTYRFPKPLEYKPVLRDILKDVPESIGAKYPESKRKVLELVPPGGYWRDLPEDIAKQYMGKSYYSGGGRTGMARRLSWDEPSLTLTCSPAQKQTERCHPDETRPFTVREYARIQSFPDEWEFTGSMSEQYKQIGNAVPVNLAKMVGLSIIHALNHVK